MSDHVLRRLERAAAGGDPNVTEAYERAMVRSKHPVIAEAFDDEIERLLASLHEHVHQNGEGEEEVRFGDLDLGALRRVVEQALAPRAGYDMGYGYAIVARGWPADREGRAERVAAWGEIVRPTLVMAFAVRRGDVLTVAFNGHSGRTATPGTCFPPLAPWRVAFKAATIERKLERWLDAYDGPRSASCSLRVARLWAELGRPDPSVSTLPTSL